jgi:hypothetical protein
MKEVEKISDFKQQIGQLASVQHLIPAVVVIHDLQGMVMWMSKMGLEQLDITVGTTSEQFGRRLLFPVF